VYSGCCLREVNSSPKGETSQTFALGIFVSLSGFISAFFFLSPLFLFFFELTWHTLPR
jgi:hypothetical protein